MVHSVNVYFSPSRESSKNKYKKGEQDKFSKTRTHGTALARAYVVGRQIRKNSVVELLKREGYRINANAVHTSLYSEDTQDGRRRKKKDRVSKYSVSSGHRDMDQANDEKSITTIISLSF